MAIPSEFGHKSTDPLNTMGKSPPPPPPGRKPPPPPSRNAETVQQVAHKELEQRVEDQEKMAPPPPIPKSPKIKPALPKSPPPPVPKSEHHVQKSEEIVTISEPNALSNPVVRHKAYQEYFKTIMMSHHEIPEAGVFREAEKEHSYEHRLLLDCQKVGEECGGTRLMNVKEMEIAVPLNPARMEGNYERRKNQIKSRIRIAETKPHKDLAKTWKNSATTVDQLLADATNIEPFFKKQLKNLGEKFKARISYGPNDEFALKSKESLARKVADDMKDAIPTLTSEQALQKIGDPIRATVILNTPDEISAFIEMFQRDCAQRGGDVTFKNIWDEHRSNGYVGVHAKMLIPSPGGGKVLAEVQIHLSQIFNGTPQCPKEMAHKIYNYSREAYGPGNTQEERKPQPPPFADQAAMLIYDSALVKILKR